MKRTSNMSITIWTPRCTCLVNLVKTNVVACWSTQVRIKILSIGMETRHSILLFDTNMQMKTNFVLFTIVRVSVCLRCCSFFRLHGDIDSCRCIIEYSKQSTWVTHRSGPTLRSSEDHPSDLSNSIVVLLLFLIRDQFNLVFESLDQFARLWKNGDNFIFLSKHECWPISIHWKNRSIHSEIWWIRIK